MTNIDYCNLTFHNDSVASNLTPQERDLEDEVLPTLRELGIGLVAYSPLSRGLLWGQITDPNALGDQDLRQHMPRYQGENLARNLKLVEALKMMAIEKSCAPAQIAIAWVLAQGQDIVPIVGTKRRTYLEENLGAVAGEHYPTRADGTT